jgi:hypothetical protein
LRSRDDYFAPEKGVLECVRALYHREMKAIVHIPLASSFRVMMPSGSNQDTGCASLERLFQGMDA